MGTSDNRRSFIQKLAAAASGAVLAYKTGFASNSKNEMEESIIKTIKPLGFQWETQDPFLFCVHHEDFFPKGNDKMAPDPKLLAGREIGQDFMIKDGWRMYHGRTVPGFPGHPHRGFETITVVRKGMVDHSDSMGASGRYGDGDVQWMTAGKGVQHAEMFPLIHKDKENTMELFQIWINLPSANKFVEPHFKMLWGESIPKYKYTDISGKKTIAEVVAGKLGEHKAPSPPPNSWAASSANEVGVWNIQMDAGAKWVLPKASPGVNRTIYFFKGDVLKISGQSLNEYHSADVKADIDLTLENGNEKGYLLILQGKPIAEPVVQHGPFVMNTRQEIQQAFADYQKTGFGGWPWPVSDPVHPRTMGRFAKHADGREEVKG